LSWLSVVCLPVRYVDVRGVEDKVAGCMALLSRILWHILDGIGLDWIANYDTVLLVLLLSTVISDVCYKHTVYTCSFFC
jgi:hypothetical protein